MNSKFLSWAALGVSLVALVLVLVGGNNQSVDLGASGTRFPNGISADSTSPVAGEVRGTSLNFTSTGTTTVALKSTSATKGICIPFNATSTNTLLNLTFAASSTAYTTIGVAPIINYGACL